MKSAYLKEIPALNERGKAFYFHLKEVLPEFADKPIIDVCIFLSKLETTPLKVKRKISKIIREELKKLDAK